MARFVLHDVLIVDDSATQRQYLCDLCPQLSIRTIRTAANGEEALTMMREALPSLLLLDLEMPRLDGVQVLQHMAREALQTPVVVISGKDPMLVSTVELMGRELGLPVLGALGKPVKHEALADLLLRAYAQEDEESERADLCSDTDIRLALDNREIVPYYQPKVTLHGQILKGAEMLARWPTTDGVISPARFIPVIEACGWSKELTLHMLDHALTQWNLWARRGLRLPLSVNISPLAMNDGDLVDLIEKRVTLSKVPPRYIIFEITETAVAENLADAMGVAARFRLAGFGLSIDDFGTGFATMQQLVRFPFTELKIDQSLVKDVSHKPHLESVVFSLIELAAKMKLTTVGEGVEFEDDQRCLEHRGCILGQGYLYSRPLSADAFEGWVKGRSVAAAGPAA